MEVYQRTYDEHEVLVRINETSKQYIKDTRIPLAPELGTVEKFVCE